MKGNYAAISWDDSAQVSVSSCSLEIAGYNFGGVRNWRRTRQTCKCPECSVSNEISNKFETVWQHPGKTIGEYRIPSLIIVAGK